MLSNSIQQLSDHTLLFSCDHKWQTGSARMHTDLSVKWPNSCSMEQIRALLRESPENVQTSIVSLL